MINGKNFKYFVTILFIIFAGFYIVSYYNYYDYDDKKRATLTKEQIKEFEKDVEAGVNIDVKKYLTLNEKNYNNKVSTITYKVSSAIGKLIEKSINVIFNRISDAMNS